MTTSSSSHRRSSTSTGRTVSRCRRGRSPGGHRPGPDTALVVSGLLILLFVTLDMDRGVIAQPIGQSDLLAATTTGLAFRQVRLVFPDLGREVAVLASGPALPYSAASSVSPDPAKLADHWREAPLLSLLSRGQRLSLIYAGQVTQRFRLANFSLLASDFNGKSIILLDLVKQTAGGSPGEITQLRLISD